MAGDEVTVTTVEGTAVPYVVDEVVDVPKAEFPTELIYGSLDYPGLRLITCGGSFDESADSYDDNIVAFATLVGSS